MTKKELSRQPGKRRQKPIKENALTYHWIFKLKLYKLGGSGIKYSNYWKRDTTSQE